MKVDISPNTAEATASAIDLSTEGLHQALQTHLGFNVFKGNQEEIVRSVLKGYDTFVIMPTGAGKSLCYQLPAMMLPGTAIIISPLIALMKNQVDNVRSYNDTDDIAHFLNSSLSKTQIRKVKKDITEGRTKMLYVAPETLTKEENIEFFAETNVSFVAVDEAHCISEWGHDFRPEYRRIRDMINQINQRVPIVALTATATPKVQSDIIKNLGLDSENLYMSSFNRDNLYYEVRPKAKQESTIRQIVGIIKEKPGQSGIIYVQSRKNTEEVAKLLNVNGIKAVAYHAGLDAKTRTKAQDDFLMEEVDVIVATIAFGMGIDKPDVRFVIHYDIPKSIENYYQETGRAGRDGLDGRCVTFYNYSDIARLEKFLRDKPVAEREMTAQLMQEMVAYAETTSCRRKFLLHYFGEKFDDSRCNGMCDNCRHPKVKTEAGEDVALALQIVEQLHEQYGFKILVDFLLGNDTKEMRDFRFNKMELFGAGKEQNDNYWQSILRNSLLAGLLRKDIESYGTLKLTDAGRQFLETPTSFKVSLNHDYDDIADAEEVSAAPAALDDFLFNMLKELRRSVAKKNNVPPYVVFQDISLEEMATQYPATMEDMAKITGVSIGKANRYAKPFIEVIARYIEDNDIDRPTDLLIKQVANKSKTKVNIINSIDKRIPLKNIIRDNNLTWEDLMDELYTIVASGTRVNLDYVVEEEIADEGIREDIYEYFRTAPTDNLEIAFKKLNEIDDFDLREVQLMRLKFISEMAN